MDVKLETQIARSITYFLMPVVTLPMRERNKRVVKALRAIRRSRDMRRTAARKAKKPFAHILTPLEVKHMMLVRLLLPVEVFDRVLSAAIPYMPRRRFVPTSGYVPDGVATVSPIVATAQLAIAQESSGRG